MEALNNEKYSINLLSNYLDYHDYNNLITELNQAQSEHTEKIKCFSDNNPASLKQNKSLNSSSEDKKLKSKYVIKKTSKSVRVNKKKCLPKKMNKRFKEGIHY